MNLKKAYSFIALVLLPLFCYADYSNYGKLSDISDSDINWWPLILIVGGFILAIVIGLIRQILGMNKDK